MTLDNAFIIGDRKYLRPRGKRSVLLNITHLGPHIELKLFKLSDIEVYLLMTQELTEN